MKTLNSFFKKETKFLPEPLFVVILSEHTCIDKTCFMEEARLAARGGTNKLKMCTKQRQNVLLDKFLKTCCTETYLLWESHNYIFRKSIIKLLSSIYYNYHHIIVSSNVITDETTEY
jgi:hypothetical protein